MTTDVLEAPADEETHAPPDAVAAEAPVGEEAPVVTEEQVQTLADGLAQQAQQFAAATEAERRQDEDTDGDHIFSGPYDPDRAMRQITRLNHECLAAKWQWERSKEETASLKKSYDARQESLNNLIQQYELRRGDSGSNGQPFLRDVSASEDGETIDQRRERLAEELEARGLFVDVSDLAPLTREDLDTLDVWREQAGPIPPEVVAQRAHVAGVSGTDGAFCKRCGWKLGRIDDATDFPEDAFVGLDCTVAATTSTVTEFVEEARPIKARGSKKTTKVDHDGERTRQKAEGTKRAAKKPATRKRR